MRRRKLAAVVALGSLVAVLAGCGGNQGVTSSGATINVFEVVVNGRYVDCVSVGSQSVDCDWGGTR